MFVVCKTEIGKEYMRSKEFSILCNNEKVADILSEHMNTNNATSCGGWKLKDGETYKVYQLDAYDFPPQYKLKTVRGKISVVKNN